MTLMKRRNFLKETVIATAGLGLSSAGLAESRPILAANQEIELAIATICLDGFGDHNFEPTFELLPQIGIRNVEFNVWYPRNITPAGIKSIRNRCYQKGLRPISLQGSSFGSGGNNVVKDVSHKLWLMAQAQAIGAGVVKFTGSKRGTNGGLENVIKVLKELAPAAEDMDVLVVVENHANNNIETIEDYDAIFQAVDSSHVGMCLDMGHFDGAGVNNFDVIKKYHSKVLHVDIKDTTAFGTYKTVPLGSGATDCVGIVKDLIKRGYKGYLVIEQAPPMKDLDIVQEMSRIKEVFQPLIQ